MDEEYYNVELFGKKFLSISCALMKNIEENNSQNALHKIKFIKLRKVAEDLNSFEPSGEILKEKKLFVEYLRIIKSKPIDEISKKELLELERDFLLPSIDGKLRQIGYTTKYGWILGTFMAIPFDVILLLFLGNFLYYIPIISILTAISRLNARERAKKEKKLW